MWILQHVIGPPGVFTNKVDMSLGNIDFFALSCFKNSEVFSVLRPNFWIIEWNQYDELVSQTNSIM